MKNFLVDDCTTEIAIIASKYCKLKKMLSGKFAFEGVRLRFLINEINTKCRPISQLLIVLKQETDNNYISFSHLTTS